MSRPVARSSRETLKLTKLTFENVKWLEFPTRSIFLCVRQPATWKAESASCFCESLFLRHHRDCLSKILQLNHFWHFLAWVFHIWVNRLLTRTFMEAYFFQRVHWISHLLVLCWSIMSVWALSRKSTLKVLEKKDYTSKFYICSGAIPKTSILNGLNKLRGCFNERQVRLDVWGFEECRLCDGRRAKNAKPMQMLLKAHKSRQKEISRMLQIKKASKGN